ncbi:hypothetical protein PWT90_10541 [Aphanocladium album]|nr:hypothetical protein PWT90_10541 [Aphanocladium album]
MAATQDVLQEGDFGPIPATEEHVGSLWGLVHSQSRLQKAGYVLWPLGQADLDKKKRCGRCTKVIRKGHERQKSRAQSVKLAPTIAQRIAAEVYPLPGKETTHMGVQSHARSMSLQTNGADIVDMMQDMTLKKDNKDGKDDKERGPPMNCRFHPGRIQSRASLSASIFAWTCCGKNISSPPCAAEQFHTTRVYRRGELESNWQYFSTPHPASTLDPSSSSSSSFFFASPPPAPVVAVVIDCEMGTAASGESELIRVSAVDFFTRRVLVDSLVWPDVKMAHFNTRYSGVSRQSMDAARRARRTLAGRAGARAALWQFIGPQTIVIGHSANSDLNALRWIHPIVIDSLLLEMRIQPREEREERGGKTKDAEQEEGAAVGTQEATPSTAEEDEKTKERKRLYPGLSLKALTAERLKREIQVRGQGHDSLEDALATRDLLVWHVVNKPEPPLVD